MLKVTLIMNLVASYESACVSNADAYAGAMLKRCRRIAPELTDAPRPDWAEFPACEFVRLLFAYTVVHVRGTRELETRRGSL
jgi:hypothetical protein